MMTIPIPARETDGVAEDAYAGEVWDDESPATEGDESPATEGDNSEEGATRDSTTVTA